MKAEEFNEKDSAIPWNLGDLNKELSVSLIGKVRAMIRGERKMPFGICLERLHLLKTSF